MALRAAGAASEDTDPLPWQTGAAEASTVAAARQSVLARQAALSVLVPHSA